MLITFQACVPWLVAEQLVDDALFAASVIASAGPELGKHVGSATQVLATVYDVCHDYFQLLWSRSQ